MAGDREQEAGAVESAGYLSADFNLAGQHFANDLATRTWEQGDHRICIASKGSHQILVPFSIGKLVAQRVADEIRG